MAAQEEPVHLGQGSLHRGDLEQHVRAGSVGGDHPLEALHLTLDAPQAAAGRIPGLTVEHSHYPRGVLWPPGVRPVNSPIQRSSTSNSSRWTRPVTACTVIA